MGVVEPLPWRFSVEDSQAGRSIRIPAERELWPLFLLPIWLTLWACAEIFVGWLLLAKIAGVPPPPSASTPSGGQLVFVALWFAFWTLAGFAAGYGWVWLLTGLEVVSLNEDTLILSRELLGWSRSREYRIGNVTTMRVVPKRERGSLTPFYYISFDYGGRTITFARRRNASELRRIVDSLGERRAGMVL